MWRYCSYGNVCAIGRDRIFPPEARKAEGGFYSVLGFCNEYLHLYLAMGLTYSPLVAEDALVSKLSE